MHTSAAVGIGLLVAVLHLGLSVAGHAATLRRSKRVINGEKMEKEEFPWLVSMKGRFWQRKFGIIPVRGSVTCGASLINHQWLISAAHCFEDRKLKLYKPSKWKAYFASKRRGPSFKDWMKNLLGRILRKKNWYMWRMKLEKIIIHPQFLYKAGRYLHFDIALLKLKKPIPYQEHAAMSPIALPTTAMSEADWPPTGTNCSFAGWGCDKVGGGAVKFATKVNFQIVEDQRCLRTYGEKFVNLENDMCAGAYMGNKGICPGDSGGPLICYKEGKPYQAGIASATAAMAPGAFPGIFTRISTFRSWILNTIANN